MKTVWSSSICFVTWTGFCIHTRLKPNRLNVKNKKQKRVSITQHELFNDTVRASYCRSFSVASDLWPLRLLLTPVDLWPVLLIKTERSKSVTACRLLKPVLFFVHFWSLLFQSSACFLNEIKKEKKKSHCVAPFSDWSFIFFVVASS